MKIQFVVTEEQALLLEAAQAQTNGHIGVTIIRGNCYPILELSLEYAQHFLEEAWRHESVDACIKYITDPARLERIMIARGHK